MVLHTFYSTSEEAKGGGGGGLEGAVGGCVCVWGGAVGGSRAAGKQNLMAHTFNPST